MPRVWTGGGGASRLPQWRVLRIIGPAWGRVEGAAGVEVERSTAATTVSGTSYRVVVPADERRRVRLEVPPGRPLAELVLLSSAHPPGAVDELTQADPIVVRRESDGLVRVFQRARSTVWQDKQAELCCRPEGPVYRATFRGRRPIDELQFFESGERDPSYLPGPTLSGWQRPPRARARWDASVAAFPWVFSPAPNGAGQVLFWHGERATNHPGAEPGFHGGDWFFTPAPFVYGLGGDGRWLIVGLAPRPDQLDFGHFEYRGGVGWGLALTYRGTIRPEGTWATPELVMLPSADPYDGLAAYRDWLDSAGLLPAASGAPPAWWREPIWCGWGEQVAREGRRQAKELSSRRNYERWLAELEQHGIWPGTIVVDDRWQARLGEPAPSRRWRQLAEFIAAQQARGRHVLLWHNVWELESPGAADGLVALDGAPARGEFGYPMVDPTAPGFAARIRRVTRRLLAPPPVGFGADGLKLDIIHSTPLGAGHELHGPGWGNGLLHRLLRELYRAAKEIREEALVESHAANPYFRDTCDVLRLNDISSDRTSVVPEMGHRARVARAAGFGLVDTDGWALPTRAALLDYAEAQPELGIPALYYATRLDRSRERLRRADYAQIAAAWARYRRSL